MDPITRQTALGAAGAAGGDPVYVDDVFSTFLYKGDGSSNRHLVTGIDNTEGCMIWFKRRNSDTHHHIVDNLRYISGGGSSGQYTGYKALASDENWSDDPVNYMTTDVTELKTDGVVVKNQSGGYVNGNGDDYVAWNFKKAPGFFDVVTYSGNGTAGRQIAHSLGSTPGMVIVKCTSHSENWAVWHRNISNTQMLQLHSADDVYNQSDAPINIWNSTSPTATHFTVGDWSGVNQHNYSYVAYIFAHDDASFGTAGDESIIKCGSYQGNGNSINVIDDLGFEPQWLLVKNTQRSTNWHLFDVMRGTSYEAGERLYPNKNYDKEDMSGYGIQPIPQGFQVRASGTDFNAYNQKHIYVAIRRPHKPPEVGTDVFAIDSAYDASPAYDANFPPDLILNRKVANTDHNYLFNRTTLKYQVITNNHTQPYSASLSGFQHMKGWGNNSGYTDSTELAWMFKRCPGFMDIVYYRGDTVTTGRNINHGLNAVPELIISKGLNFDNYWMVYHKDLGASKYMELDGNGPAHNGASYWGNGSNGITPTSTVFTVGGDNSVNYNTKDHVAFLFTSLPNICKIGTYQGDGTNNNQQDLAGYTAAPRFLLIKANASSSDWYLFDSLRGLSSGNDPYTLLNLQSAQTTNQNYVHGYAGGFTPLGILNTDSTDYIYMAIF